MNLKSLAKSSFLYLLGNVASRAVGFLMIPVYARCLRPDEYGLIELLELCTQVAAICIGLQSVGGAMSRIYFEYSDRRDRAAVVSSAVLSTAGLGTALAILAVTAAAPLSLLTLGSRQYASLTATAFVAMSLATLGEVVLVYYRMLDKAVFFVGYSLVQLVVSLALNIYFIKFQGMGVWGFVYTKLITGASGTLLLSCLLFRETGIHWRWEPVKKMAIFGYPLIVSSLAMFVIHFSDRFFLEKLGGLTAVGVYALAYKFAFLVTYLVGEPFAKVWYATVYSYTRQDGWLDDFLRIGRYLVFCLFLAGLAVALFINQAMAIVASPAFAAAAGLVPVLALGYVLRGMGDFYRSLLYVHMRSAQASQIAAFCGFVNLALNYWLIQNYLAFGAAYATLLTWAAYLGCCWSMSRKQYQIAFPLKSFALVFCTAAGVYWCSRWQPDLPAVFQWGRSALLLVMFVGLLWMFRYFPLRERELIYCRLARLRCKLTSE
jgi:O-antigen/teichoic acid export membrane protein